MSFFQDLIAGRGKLHESITPSWLRRAVPKELQPNGLMPARDWFGMDLDGSLKKAAQAQEAQRIATEQAYGQGLFNQGATMPIPGVTGPTMPMQPPTMQPPPATGLLGGPPQDPTLREIPNQQQPVSQFQSQGPYGDTAMLMAGLLPRRTIGVPRRGLLGMGGK